MLELIDARDQLAPVHIRRPTTVAGGADPAAVVDEIVDAVRHRGDEALIEYGRRFDGVSLTAEQLRVPEETVTKARSVVRPELLSALEVMAERLRATCERQLPLDWLSDGAGEQVGEMIRPLRRVGLYVPGGRASYPSSVVMAAVPASVAGVEGIAVASPPGPDGEVAEQVLAACAVSGVSEVYRVGGAQAVAALAYGTESVRPVEKIVGPGNLYVTLAKRRVRGWVGIDTEAGPTEILIVADENADPNAIAADLVAQAEHGPHGSHVLITWAQGLAESVMEILELHVAGHERADDVENALIEGGRAVLVRDLKQAMETVNAFAPEHLQLDFTGDHAALDQVRNAGSVFVGPYSPVPVGDYVGGTNHVLPTGGAARWSSGLGVGDFVKRIYVSSFERDALERLAPHVEALAEAEGLPGHARAVQARLEGPVLP
ncbi:MAG TPA: histidinol dehydrogenase [Actinomycetota bacterium]|nr:histidinol dehydrogenase [Actinomycetota bacterium]